MNSGKRVRERPLPLFRISSERFCPEMERKRQTPGYFLLFAAALLCTALFVGNAIVKTEGQPYLPLDDPYIFFVYAQNASHGLPFRYNAEDSPSLGITSFLYYLVCTAGYLAGFRGDGMVWFSQLLGFLALAACMAAAFRFYTHRGITHALPAVLVTFLMGKVVWGFLCGMEIPLYTLFIFTGACAFAREKKKLFFFLFALAALTRPEGLVLLFLSSLLWAGWDLRRGNFKSAIGDLLAPALCGLCYLVIFTSAGRIFNTAVQKSPFFSGDSGLGLLMMRTNENYNNLLRYLWGYGTGFLALTPLLILAMIKLRGREWIFPALFLFGFFVEGLIAFGMWHHQRYFIPYLPAGFMVLAVGLERALVEKKTLRLVARSALLLFIGWTVLYWADLYGDNCRDMKWSNGKMVEFSHKHLEPSSVLLVSDAGLFKYKTDHYVLDFFGLGISSLTPSSTRGGPGCVFEGMRRILREGKPERIRGCPVYGFTYPGFGGAVLEKAAAREPGDFLKTARQGDLLLIGAYDSGEKSLDEDMVAALDDLNLGWPDIDCTPRSRTAVAACSVVGHDDISSMVLGIEDSLEIEAPPGVSGDNLIRVSVHKTWDLFQPYIEKNDELLVRPNRPFQFALLSSDTLRIKGVLSYRSVEEGSGIAEFPLAWLPYYGFFGFRHQMGEDKVSGYLINPAVYDGSQKPEIPGSLEKIPDDVTLTSPVLNVGELVSESAFDFSFRSMSKERQCTSVVERRREPDDSFLLDGGRRITGACSFTIRVTPGKPVYILGRFGNEWPIRIKLSLNGSPLKKPWFFASGKDKKWQYNTYLLPGEEITGKDRIELEVMDTEWPHFTVYHIWFYQPREKKS